MVYRIYVEKKPGFDVEANGLKNELTSLLGIKDLTGLRLLNRYDVEGITEELFATCTPTQSCPLPRACPSRWSICPVSSTSVQPLLPSASSSSVRASARWCALPVSTCWRVL